ncbi:MAG: right-handed parallel beta-helix repeat-containing protein [Planctomycetota bacterium]|jgi:hypothetical protein|nr:right-handed parallel beta-helix repeat-containing protein [Planctomycetota bacterium]
MSTPDRFYLNSTTGDDQAAGTSPDTAWRSIARANRQALLPGQRLLLLPGVHRGSLHPACRGDESADPIVIAGIGTERAVIEAESGDAVACADVGGLAIRDLVCRGRGAENGIAIRNALSGARVLSGIEISNCDCSGFSNCGIVVLGCASDYSQSGFAGVRITGSRCWDNRYYGCKLDAPWDEAANRHAHRDVVIRNCQFFDNRGDPSYMENHSGSGLLIDGVDGALIESCSAWGNGLDCHATVGGPCGIWAHACNRAVIRRCVSHHNAAGSLIDGDGFDFDAGVTNSVMEHNLSYHNGGAGYMVYDYDQSPRAVAGNVVCDNVSVDDCRHNCWYGAIHVFAHHPAGICSIRITDNRVLLTAPDATARDRAIAAALACHHSHGATILGNHLEVIGNAYALRGGANRGALVGSNHLSVVGDHPVVRWDDRDYPSYAAWCAETGYGEVQA